MTIAQSSLRARAIEGLQQAAADLEQLGEHSQAARVMDVADSLRVKLGQPPRSSGADFVYE